MKKKLIAVFLVLAMLLALCGCEANDYKAAQKLMESGSYEEAAAAFTALGEYKDSAAQAQECSYLAAAALFDGGDHAAAKTAFAALGGYKDSADKVTECEYVLAKALYDSGDLEAAVPALEALGEYKDAASLASEGRDTMLRNALVGKWTVELDMTEEVNATIAAISEMAYANLEEQGVELPTMEYEEVRQEIILEMKENGTYEMSATAESLDGFMQSMKNGLRKYLLDVQAVLVENNLKGSGYTLEEAMKEDGIADLEELFSVVNGISVDDLLAYMGVDELRQTLEESSREMGVYKVNEGTAILKYGDEVTEITYDAEADTLTVPSDTVDMEGNEITLELKFTRA